VTQINSIHVNFLKLLSGYVPIRLLYFPPRQKQRLNTACVINMWCFTGGL